MKTASGIIFLTGIFMPFCANATNLKQFNAECGFLQNTIKGKNTTGGDIIKADETVVHEFSIDLINNEYCALDSCTPSNEEIVRKDGIIVTNTSGSGGVPDEDGDVYELSEFLNLKTDIYTLQFKYFDEKNTKEIGSSRIDYQCKILPFEG